jgi:hypothetical protein
VLYEYETVLIRIMNMLCNKLKEEGEETAEVCPWQVEIARART